MAGADAVERDLEIRLTTIVVVAEGGYFLRCSCDAARFVPRTKAAAEDAAQFLQLHDRCDPGPSTVRVL